MLCLVTGGAGFIGSNLVRSLLAEGHTVRVIDDLSTGKASNLHEVADDVERILGDVRDPDMVDRAVRGVEAVFHLAALPSVARSIADPIASHQVNATGTLNVLDRAARASVRRVVYASSSSVYGDTPILPKHEAMPVSPRSPYAASKLAGESYARSYATSMSLETASLRFFNVFGPRQDPESQYAAVIPLFIRRMSAGDPPIVFGDGLQTRDFTYIDNVTSACIAAATSSSAVSGLAMNVGCGDRINLLDLIEDINGLLGSEIEPTFAPARSGDVRDSQASIDLAAELIGYAPQTTLRAGLQETIAWFASSDLAGINS